MRLTTILVTYLIVGAVMFGGGVLAWDDAGVAGYLIEDPETGEVNEDVSSDLESARGPIQEAAGAVGGGGLLAVWTFLSNLFSFLYWPISTLNALGAPPAVTAILGGPLSLGFTLGMIRLVASSI